MWELLVEFFEDYYANDKKRMWRDDKKEFGHVRLPSTGDPLIDRWNKQIERGETPDLTEGMLPAEREKALAKMREIAEVEKARMQELEQQKSDAFFNKGKNVADAYASEFSDVYTTHDSSGI